MMTEQSGELVTLAEIVQKHRFYYQDIGPIHYICWCHEPHTHFCDRDGWAAHVAEVIEREYVANAKVSALREAADRVEELWAGPFYSRSEKALVAWLRSQDEPRLRSERTPDV